MSQFKTGTLQSLSNSKTRLSTPNGSRKGSLYYTSNSKATTISPPTQEIDHTKPITHHRPKCPTEEGLLGVPKSSGINRNRNRNPLAKLNRKRFQPIDSLSSGGLSSVQKKQKKSKNGIEVAIIHSSQSDDSNNNDVFDFEDSPSSVTFKHSKHSHHFVNDHSSKKKEIKNSDEVFNLLASVKNTENFISDMDELKKNSSDSKTKKTKHSDKLDALLNDNNDSIVDNVIEDIEGLKQFNNKSMKSLMSGNSETVEAVRQKYKKEFPELNPDILDKDQILERVEKYIPFVKKILKRSEQSFFYDLAKQIADSSHRSVITDMEIIGMPKNKYHGYFGQKRQSLIAQYLEQTLENFLRESSRHDKTIQFWGKRYFTMYVLSPEVISRMIIEDMMFDDTEDKLKKAYEFMVLTNDYGFYLMDKNDPDEVEFSVSEDENGSDNDNDNDLQVSSSTEKKSTKLKVSLHDNPDFLDSDSDSDDDDLDSVFKR
ncbi:unnamed protein product [Ambrosiozyma monospora]|uniref:Restriction of telomere capping protein 4 n=1 Tax=Ambrosiozyma monospora TaxID=43982 RepID=A0A9W7DFI9_AMBMO|nr:unnamed protein product [Ambrosiozyma monospora]